MFGKSNKPSPIDSLIGTGTTIEGNITFTGGLRIDGHVKGNVKANGNKPGTLVVSELAKVEGDIDVAHVVINGTVAGPVLASRTASAPTSLVNLSGPLGGVFRHGARIASMATNASPNSAAKVHGSQARRYDGFAGAAVPACPIQL